MSAMCHSICRSSIVNAGTPRFENCSAIISGRIATPIFAMTSSTMSPPDWSAQQFSEQRFGARTRVCNALIQYESAFEQNKGILLNIRSPTVFLFARTCAADVKSFNGCRAMGCDSNSGFKGKIEAANSMSPARSSSSNRRPPCSKS